LHTCITAPRCGASGFKPSIDTIPFVCLAARRVAAMERAVSTAGYVKLLLPPRQSRGNSHVGLARIHQGRRYGLQEWARRQNKDANERLRVRARAGNTLSDQSARSIDGARGRLRRDGPLLEFRRPLAVGARSHASFHAWVSGIGYCGICQCFRGTAGSGRAIGGRCARVPVPSFVAHSSSHISLDSRALKCKALSGNEWRITCRRSY